MCLKFRVKRTEHLLDIIREVESEIESFHAMLDASVIVHQLGDVRISERRPVFAVSSKSPK